MKQKYEKPMLEVEVYELDTSIASNCRYVVNMGPISPIHEPCESYYEIAGEPMPYSVNPQNNYNVDFWQELNCDCYTSASGKFFTS